MMQVLRRLIDAPSAPATTVHAHGHPHSEADRIRRRIEAYTQAIGRPVYIRAYRHVGGVLTFLCYRPHISITIADLERAARNMPPHVGVAWVRVIRAPNGAILLQTPAPTTRFFLADDAIMAQSGLRVSLGPLTSARGQAIVDLDHPSTAHLLIVAATGGGKTTLEHTLIYRLARQNPPDTLRFLMIDPKNALAAALDDSAHLLHPVARADKPGAIEIMRWLVAEIDRRERDGQNVPRIVVIIDELIGLARSSLFSEALAVATAKGRSLGIHVVASTQYATRELLGTGVIKENFTARIVGRTLSPQSSNYATGEAGYECHTLTGLGDFVFIPQKQRFQCAYVTEAMLRALPRSAPARLNFAALSTPEPDEAKAKRIDFTPQKQRREQTRMQQVRRTAERIADILSQHPGMSLDSVGRNQWQRWLWPEDATTGGQKGQWVSEAIAMLRAERADKTSETETETETETGTHG